MTVFKKGLLFSVLVGLLTACFEVKEKVELQEDGSGQYTFEINLGKLKKVLQMSDHFQEAMQDSSHANMNTTKPENPLEQILKQFSEISTQMESISGVSDYQVVWDSVGYTVAVTFSFSSIEALNAGVNQLQEDNPSSSRRLFNYSGNVFERITTQDVTESADQIAQDSTQAEMFKTSTFHTEYTFTRSVKEYTNDAYFISRDRKTVIAEFVLYDIATGKQEVGTVIEFGDD